MRWVRETNVVDIHYYFLQSATVSDGSKNEKGSKVRCSVKLIIKCKSFLAGFLPKYIAVLVSWSAPEIVLFYFGANFSLNQLPILLQQHKYNKAH